MLYNIINENYMTKRDVKRPISDGMDPERSFSSRYLNKKKKKNEK